MGSQIFWKWAHPKRMTKETLTIKWCLWKIVLPNGVWSTFKKNPCGLRNVKPHSMKPSHTISLTVRRLLLAILFIIILLHVNMFYWPKSLLQRPRKRQQVSRTWSMWRWWDFKRLAGSVSWGIDKRLVKLHNTCLFHLTFPDVCPKGYRLEV